MLEFAKTAKRSYKRLAQTIAQKWPSRPSPRSHQIGRDRGKWDGLLIIWLGYKAQRPADSADLCDKRNFIMWLRQEYKPEKQRFEEPFELEIDSYVPAQRSDRKNHELSKKSVLKLQQSYRKLPLISPSVYKPTRL